MDHTPATETAPVELFSLNRLSRKLDIPYSRAFALMMDKTVSPDFIADRNYLFRASRLPEIKATIKAAATVH